MRTSSREPEKKPVVAVVAPMSALVIAALSWAVAVGDTAVPSTYIRLLVPSQVYAMCCQTPVEGAVVEISAVPSLRRTRRLVLDRPRRMAALVPASETMLVVFDPVGSAVIFAHTLIVCAVLVAGRFATVTMTRLLVPL